MNEFKFQLNQKVQVGVSGESGDVIGRAEYSKGQNSYLVRYQASDGRAVEAWWSEDALVA